MEARRDFPSARDEDGPFGVGGVFDGGAGAGIVIFAGGDDRRGREAAAVGLADSARDADTGGAEGGGGEGAFTDGERAGAASGIFVVVVKTVLDLGDRGERTSVFRFLGDVLAGETGEASINDPGLLISVDVDFTLGLGLESLFLFL